MLEIISAINAGGRLIGGRTLIWHKNRSSCERYTGKRRLLDESPKNCYLSKKTIMPKEYLHERKPPLMCRHVAVRLNENILVFGGEGYKDEDDMKQGKEMIYHSNHIIWRYNINNNMWRKYTMPLEKKKPFERSGACAVRIGQVVFFCGGHNENETVFRSTTLWTLSKAPSDNFEWKKVHLKHKKKKTKPKPKTPSSRSYPSGWEYEGNLWIFGGYGENIVGPNYLSNHGTFQPDDPEDVKLGGSNNQIHCYNLRAQKWTNPKCDGAVPSPRSYHATAKVNDKVYLYGGQSGVEQNHKVFKDLYELGMDTLIWTEIEVNNLVVNIPPALYSHTFTTMDNDNQIALYGGVTEWNSQSSRETWTYNIESKSWKRRNPIFGVHARFDHTATPASNGVIVFGGIQWKGFGKKKCYPVPCNGVAHIHINVMSFEQLALNAAYKHRGTTQAEWKTLPKHLYDQLEAMWKCIPTHRELFNKKASS